MAYGRSRASAVLDGFTLNPFAISCSVNLSTDLHLAWPFMLVIIINGKFRLVPLCFVTRGKARLENSLSPFRKELSMGWGCFDPGVADNGAISIQLS
ncbi:hypothetical protein glysoja_039173 [Glycine soja]|uniref:Uncharacterized protein n=1 Tax=Glycine soja TaxID=3848 RepID=A0A0B2RGD8_GLYSO|nr:hypothetical protein glysoja_039173 [Glycine soja]